MPLPPLQSFPLDELFLLGAVMILLGVLVLLAGLLKKVTKPLLGVAGAVLLLYLARAPTVPVLSGAYPRSSDIELVKGLLTAISTRFVIDWVRPENAEGINFDLSELSGWIVLIGFFIVLIYLGAPESVLFPYLGIAVGAVLDAVENWSNNAYKVFLGVTFVLILGAVGRLLFF